jgi:phospholipid/cholesterol/gamma-HCH transport system substrate-binding protein
MLKPESRVIQRSFFVGLGGLAVITILMYLTFSAQYGNPFASKTEIKAVFSDLHALQLKDPVRQNSKGIGRVIDIEYEKGSAVVTLQVEEGGDYKVYKNATAFVGDQSAVGSKFVGINPGTPESGELPGKVIPLAQTKSSRDISQVLNIFDDKTRTNTVGFLRNFGGGLAGHADGFRDFMHNAPSDLNGLGAIAGALSAKEANLPGLLTAADQLSSRFKGREPEIASLINQADQTFQAISVDNGKPLASILQKGPDTLAKVKSATDSLNAPLADAQQAMVDFQPGAQGLGASTNDLRGTLRDGVPVLNDTPDVADKAAPALKDLTPTFADVRPLAPKVTTFLNRFSTPLRALAPFSKELGYLFVRGNSFVSEGGADGVHHARLNADFQGVYSFTGGFLQACNFQTNPYPKPGQADRDQTGLNVKHQVPCGISGKGLEQPIGGK